MNRKVIISIVILVLLTLGLGNFLTTQNREGASTQKPISVPANKIHHYSPIASTTPDGLVKSPYLMAIQEGSRSFYAYRSEYMEFCTVKADSHLNEAESAMVSADGKPSYGNDGPLAGVRNYLCNDSKEAWAATVPTPDKKFICLDSADTYIIVTSPLISGQTSCGSSAISTQKPSSPINYVEDYKKLERQLIAEGHDLGVAKKAAEASFYSDASAMGMEMLSQCDMWPLTNELIAGRHHYVTIGSVNITKQNCGRGTPKTFELDVLPQKGIITCKATLTETSSKFSGCSSGLSFP